MDKKIWEGKARVEIILHYYYVVVMMPRTLVKM